MGHIHILSKKYIYYIIVTSVKYSVSYVGWIITSPYRVYVIYLHLWKMWEGAIVYRSINV